MIYRNKESHVYASELAEFLGQVLYGEDFIVKYPGYYQQDKTIFAYANDLSDLNIVDFKADRTLFVISEQLLPTDACFSYIISSNPKLDFLRIVNTFYTEISSCKISPTAEVSQEAKLGQNVSVGNNSMIGPDVVIGDDCIIMNNVIMSGRITIGCNCVIKDNCVVGSEGYDYEIDESGNPILFPHFGKITINDYVIIGSNSTIESTTLRDTVIGHHSKIDDLVQIGSGVVIGDRTMIAAGAVICRNSQIGSNVWIAPNVSIKENVKLGDASTIGIGSVVLNNVPDNVVCYGNPAKTYVRRK